MLCESYFEFLEIFVSVRLQKMESLSSFQCLLLIDEVSSGV